MTKQSKINLIIAVLIVGGITGGIFGVIYIRNYIFKIRDVAVEAQMRSMQIADFLIKTVPEQVNAYNASLDNKQK